MKKISLLLILFYVSIFVNAQSQKGGVTGNGNHDLSERMNASALSFKLSAYPNPAVGNVTISFISETNSKLTLSIVDMIGRVKVTENILVNEGLNQRQINLENLVKGLYMVIIHSEGKNDQATRLIVE